MRNLKYAILGLLNERSMTGYELMKEFESTLNEFWSAKHSQIYPELKKLCDEDCLVYDIEISGTSLEKKVYTITDKGREEFMEWLESDTVIDPSPKEIARLKIFFSHQLSGDKREALLNDLLLQHQSRLEHLLNNQKKFNHVPDVTQAEFSDYLVLLGAIMREETTCNWLKECIALCK